MNVSIFSLFVLFAFCAKESTLKIKIPANLCRINNQALEFEKVVDLSSCLRNQKRASVYFYQQREQFANSIKCYESIINEINK